MSANDWMAQDIADILALEVERPASVETTALGTAMLAGVGGNIFATLDDAAIAMRGEVRRFLPIMSQAAREVRIADWQSALASV